MNIYGGIDGTGPSDDQVYRRDFANSFVRKIWSDWENVQAYYLRGPHAHGMSTGVRSRVIAQKVKERYSAQLITARQNPQFPHLMPRIFLAGYSRGGSAVIDAARSLGGQGIPVHCLILFDAVDRSATSDGGIIPANVRYCFHAKRSPRANSRTSFGNTGNSAARGVDFRTKRGGFFCTHGGLGGCPWTQPAGGGFIREGYVGETGGTVVSTILGGAVLGPLINNEIRAAETTAITVAQDRIGSRQVWNWMEPLIREAKNAPYPEIARVEAAGG